MSDTPSARRVGPVDPSGRPCFLPLQGCLSTGYDAMCPHCKEYCTDEETMEGGNVCCHCGKVFFLRLTRGVGLITSKRAIIHEFLWN
jgi:hypothetical protein